MLFRCTLLEFNLITEWRKSAEKNTNSKRNMRRRKILSCAFFHSHSHAIIAVKLNWISTYFSFSAALLCPSKRLLSFIYRHLSRTIDGDGFFFFFYELLLFLLIELRHQNKSAFIKNSTLRIHHVIPKQSPKTRRL